MAKYTLTANIGTDMLEQLIKEYFIKEGYPVQNMDMSFNFVAGRGGNESRVEVLMVPKGETHTPVVEETIEEEPTVEEVVEEVVPVVEEPEVVETDDLQADVIATVVVDEFVMDKPPVSFDDDEEEKEVIPKNIPAPVSFDDDATVAEEDVEPWVTTPSVLDDIESSLAQAKEEFETTEEPVAFDFASEPEVKEPVVIDDETPVFNFV